MTSSRAEPRRRARFQKALDACVEGGSPGAILAIDAPRLRFSFTGSSGLFEKGGRRELKAEDPFRAASVSKTVTAAAAVRLAASGCLGLDDPAGRFLSESVAGDLRRLAGLEDVREMTLRQLLSHRSGLPDYFFDERFQARTRAEPDRLWRPDELIGAAAEIGKLEFAPGTGFSYGDTGYVLAGMIIESVAGCSLAEAYRSLVFSPLGMESTYLEWHEPYRGAEVSHHYDGERDLLPMNTSFDWGGGGLVATAPDLVRFLRGLFDGILFEERWLAEMTAWRSDVAWRPDSSARYLRYGLGLGVNVAAGEELFGATGVWGAFAYHWPAGGAAIAGTLNMKGADRGTLLDAVVSSMK